jgi:hypothetical protein
LTVAAILLATVGVATLVCVVRSEAYRVAERFAASNEAVREVIGDVGSTRLGFGSLGFRSSESYSAVNFTMVVHGDRGDIAVTFVVTKSGDGRDWIIDSAMLDRPTERVNLVDRTFDDTRKPH